MGHDDKALRMSLFAQQVAIYNILQAALLATGRVGLALAVAEHCKGERILRCNKLHCTPALSLCHSGQLWKSGPAGHILREVRHQIDSVNTQWLVDHDKDWEDIKGDSTYTHTHIGRTPARKSLWRNESVK